MISQMEREENREDSDEDNWWEAWDRRQRMAVVQVICYAVYAICIYHFYYSSECDEPSTSVESRKRKAGEWERDFRGIREAINDVAKAIREGNAIIEKTQECVPSEAEVFAELVKIGVEQPLRFRAYNFLVEDPAMVRAFFGYPVEERKEFLLQMMYGPEDT